jgi:hypothetical protein
MLKQPAYLYKNTQYLYTDLVTSNTGYKKMYAKTLKLYKGIDNTFELKLLSGDQKRLDVIGYTVFWQLLDRNTAELKYITSVEVDGPDNSIVTITIPEGDLETINSGFYTYSSYIVTPTGTKRILYGDSQYGASVTVEVINNSFPQIYASQEIVEFIPSPELGDTILYTSAINARPELNNNNTVHTCTVYSSGFTGSVEIQATLENSVGAMMNWAVIETISIADLIEYRRKNERLVELTTTTKFSCKINDKEEVCVCCKRPLDEQFKKFQGHNSIFISLASIL